MKCEFASPFNQHGII